MNNYFTVTCVLVVLWLLYQSLKVYERLSVNFHSMNDIESALHKAVRDHADVLDGYLLSIGYGQDNEIPCVQSVDVEVALTSLEKSNTLSDLHGYFFLMDSEGREYANGRDPSLCISKDHGRRPGTKFKDMSRENKLAVHAISKKAKQGSGAFVHYSVQDDSDAGFTNMVAFVSKLKSHDLILGGAVPDKLGGDKPARLTKQVH